MGIADMFKKKQNDEPDQIAVEAEPTEQAEQTEPVNMYARDATLRLFSAFSYCAKIQLSFLRLKQVTERMGDNVGRYEAQTCPYPSLFYLDLRRRMERDIAIQTLRERHCYHDVLRDNARNAAIYDLSQRAALWSAAIAPGNQMSRPLVVLAEIITEPINQMIKAIESGKSEISEITKNAV